MFWKAWQTNLPVLQTLILLFLEAYVYSLAVAKHRFAALEQMQQIKGSIVNTLKLHLQNNKITLNIVLAEFDEQERSLTRREQYEEMEKENPAVKQLRDMLNLELA